ncbi:TetR/AcrR family transcriptional regulator [Catenulispora yoronensis]|uniref:TetR/AcrR family transcriptional regulator n=1 Tax=Catenulispora yoronensis TaxID=450799 RepID=A0ABP5GCJ7_9ACTN
MTAPPPTPEPAPESAPESAPKSAPKSAQPAARPRRTGGRVRNADAHTAILDATAELLEEVGYASLTMEGIATRADVAKSTIYRWWKSKGVLAMDAYAHVVAARMPEPDTGSLRGDLVGFVRELYRVGKYPLRVRTLQGLMAEAQLDASFAPLFQEWTGQRRAVVRAMFARAVARGELAATTDIDHAVDVIFGVFWYRLLLGHEHLKPSEAEVHVDRLLDGIRGAEGRG